MPGPDEVIALLNAQVTAEALEEAMALDAVDYFNRLIAGC
jgi:hypothetical protein